MGSPYSALREGGRATIYAENKTAVSADVTFAGFAYAFFIVTFSFVVILPGIRKKNGIYAAVRFFVGAFIGATILLSIYGQDWEVASQHNVTTQYKAFIKDEIKADIGVRIGLTNVNITLKGVPEYPKHGEVKGERINYNERFTFCCRQGRAGFSQFAGRINQEFREAQWQGKPYPILWIAEYFLFDAEDIRWGRSYRLSGFYTYLTLWTAFPLWIIAIITSFMVVRYCGIFLILTGSCLLSSNIMYSFIRYGSELIIPFSEEHVLVFSKGGSFYLCMVGGIVSTVAGLAIVIFDDFYPFWMASFFSVDPLQDYQDTFVDPKQLAKSSGFDDDTTKNGSPRIFNDDPRTDKLAAEAMEKRTSEVFKGDTYINVAEMRQSFVSSRKSLFVKNKPRRRQASRETDSIIFDHDEEWDGNTSSTQRLHNPQQVRFSVKGLGGKATIGDSVAMDAVTTTSNVQMIKMSQLPNDEPHDEDDEIDTASRDNEFDNKASETGAKDNEVNSDAPFEFDDEVDTGDD